MGIEQDLLLRFVLPVLVRGEAGQALGQQVQESGLPPRQACPQPGAADPPDLLVLGKGEPKPLVLLDQDGGQVELGDAGLREGKLVVEDALDEALVEIVPQVVPEALRGRAPEPLPDQPVGVPVEAPQEGVHLVLDVSLQPLASEELLDDLGHLLGVGEPEEVQEPQPAVVGDDVGGDLGEEREVGSLGVVAGGARGRGQPGVGDPSLRQGLVGGSDEGGRPGLQAGVEFHHQDRVCAGGGVALREPGKVRPKELGGLLQPPLDESRDPPARPVCEDAHPCRPPPRAARPAPPQTQGTPAPASLPSAAAPVPLSYPRGPSVPSPA